ncbi:P-loop containing nucleoside triphosphate hydrolase protein [Jimgerdemannia flammicorona]|uniref:P-loop containing nucleoside triphosphate hydrolase protein n=1 Tax=Jimgerdemannia flammicorona TaxID=994334 RepID=A0A433D8G0_9FUNG|nr:P-loop containing nucleoside triphosphate hydrolase protein [Jimgerdemannia flammicorona]
MSRKKEKTSSAPGNALGGKKPNKASPSSTETPAVSNEPKKLFDGWTGKTPATILNEFCQKQGWEKPIFEMGNFREGFVCTTVLGKLNKKLGQIETLKMSPPYVYKPTPLEARHLSATYVLHRVNSNMPMYRILPPIHRDYWIELDEVKQRETAQSRAWRYAPDPFTAKPPERGSGTASVSALDKAKTSGSNSPTASGRASPSPEFGTVPRGDDGMDERTRKYWESLPMVNMSAENRAMVEEIVKKLAELYPINENSNLTNSEKDALRAVLLHMGFRGSHVEEALEYCWDEATALDWLCMYMPGLFICVRVMCMRLALSAASRLHVPEDDLPPRFLKANYNPTMRTISHTPSTLGRDWTLQRMTAIGFPLAACEEALDEGGDDEAKALQVLQWRLVHGDEERLPQLDLAGFDAEELASGRLDEAMVLESIYDTRFEKVSESTYRVLIPPKDGTYRGTSRSGKSKQGAPVHLEVQIPPDSAYPHVLPILIIRSDGLPAYIKLAAMKDLVREAETNLTFIGSPMVGMCIEWLEEHLWTIVENPPKLREVTEGFARMQLGAANENNGDAMADSHSKPSQRRRRNNPNQGPRSRNDSRDTSEALLAALREIYASPAYQPIRQIREKLPAHSFRDNVINAVRANQVVIVSGETGCGKTTQVPQFILDASIEEGKGHETNILCTQPRRISAMGVADRVATERCGKIGETVGYAIRGETKTSAQTRLLFCTTGVLLRRLHSDPCLVGVSHVLVDEVHERSVDSDFLLIILRELLKRRADLKLVLMSATINQELFSAYFGGAPAIEIPGFTHPVQEQHVYLEDILRRTRHVSSHPTPKRFKDDTDHDTWREEYAEQGYDEATIRALESYRNSDKIDYDLIAATVKNIIEGGAEKGLEEFGGGAILIFLPGMFVFSYFEGEGFISCRQQLAVLVVLIQLYRSTGLMEIKRCIDTLESSLPRSNQYQILPLHASLSPQEQNKVFKPAPKGARKIVVATNVAETSITIDGVVYVIDSGRVKETQYDPANNMTNLVETWTSRASARQRRGRAGRTRPGQCFRLYTRAIEVKKMQAQQTPEMLRIPLEQLALSVKAMGEKDVQRFLQKAINPPSTGALKTALQTLVDVGAIHDGSSSKLTALGKHMVRTNTPRVRVPISLAQATIPADLRISKMLLFGAIFRCLDPILSVAAIMSVKSPFVSPMDKREEARAYVCIFSTTANSALFLWMRGAREAFSYARSDWLTDLKAFEAWDEQRKEGGSKAARSFCERNFLSNNTLLEISALRSQYFEALSLIGFASIDGPSADRNANAHNLNLLKSIIFAGLYPNLIRIKMPDAKYDKMISGTVERDREAREIKFYTRNDPGRCQDTGERCGVAHDAPLGRVFIHPSSILFHANNFSPPFLVYFSRMATSKTFIHDGTEVPLYAILLFGGAVNVNHMGRGLEVGQGGWIKLRAWARIGVLVNQLRRLLDAILDSKIADPTVQVSSSLVVEAMLKLISGDGV